MIIDWYICNSYGDIIWILEDGSTHQGLKEDFDEAVEKYGIVEDKQWQTT